MTAPDWREYAIAPDASHHLHRGRPAYRPRFNEVLKFHPPGLAPVSDPSGAYHITPDGLPAYPSRYLRAFGFYQDRAAVHSPNGWLHILPAGSPLYQETYDWCGNFQDGRCTVRQRNGAYRHITADGLPAYPQLYRYAGDFRDGCAVVQRDDGKHTHIGPSGNLIHNLWFDDLDVFHKGYARACDAHGWHHVNMRGQPLYAGRFKAIEPFYNGQSRVEEFDGGLSVIDESGATLLTLRPPRRSPLESLSGDLVGFWRTQTIRAAVELGVLEILPAPAEKVEAAANLAPSLGTRLLRALAELGLVRQDNAGIYHPTSRGAHLTRAHPLSLSDAALMWGQEPYAAWSALTSSLWTGESAFQKIYGQKLFDWIQSRPADLETFQSALSTYARHDYRNLPETIDFSPHHTILDAGGGQGELMFALLRACPNLQGIIMERPEVAANAQPPSGLAARCRFAAGDLFTPWPARADAIILARVLHDWPDSDALRILKQARAAITENGTLYLVELTLDETAPTGGLLDLHVLVMTQGAERTPQQFANLLKAANFQMRQVIPTNSVSSIITATPTNPPTPPS